MNGHKMTGEQRQAIEAELRDMLARRAVDAAARHIIRNYGSEIFGYLAKKMNDPRAAEEVYAQFSLDMWRGLASFEPRAMVRTWAYRVAHNACARYYDDAYRRRCRRLLTDEQEELLQETKRKYNPEPPSADDRIEHIRCQLPAEDHELLMLHLERGMAWNEVAEVMGISHDAARQRFRRLKHRIRELLGRA